MTLSYGDKVLKKPVRVLTAPLWLPFTVAGLALVLIGVLTIHMQDRSQWRASKPMWLYGCFIFPVPLFLLLCELVIVALLIKAIFLGGLELDG